MRLEKDYFEFFLESFLVLSNRLFKMMPRIRDSEEGEFFHENMIHNIVKKHLLISKEVLYIGRIYYNNHFAFPSSTTFFQCETGIQPAFQDGIAFFTVSLTSPNRSTDSSVKFGWRRATSSAFWSSSIISKIY